MPRVPSWAVLTTMVGVSTLVRAWAGLRVPSPWIAADEMIYAELGRSLWETGRLDVLGADVPFYSLAHPALIGLPLALFDTATGYDVARVLQALVMSLTAVPVFLWGRTLMSERWALVAAVLTLAIPGLAYSGLLMTETVFYGAMTLAAWAMANALVRPTRRAQLLLVGAIVLAVLTRLQALALVPVFVLAVVLLAALERSTVPIRRAAPALAAVVALGLVWIATGGFGAYGPAGGGYDVGDALRFVFFHAGDALILIGLAPACAVALLVVHAVRGSEASNSLLLGPERAYLAVAIAFVAGLVAEVGVFASRYVGRLAERDLLAIAPILFIGLCLWLDRGAPRSRVSASVAALAAAAFVVFLPFGRLVHKAALTDAFMLVPVWQLGSYDLVIGAAVAGIVVLFVLVPRALPVALAALFLLVSVSATRFVEREAQTLRTSFFAGDPTWIDAAADGDVTYFYDGEPHWNAVWAHVFWNRRIRHVVDLPARRVPGPLPQRPVPVRPDGALDGAPRYVVGSTAFTFVGEPHARIDQHGLVQKGLVLWRVEPPLRLSTAVTGVQGSGDIYGPAQLVAYDCEGGALALTLVAKGSGVAVTIRRNGQEFQTLQLAAEQVWSSSVPAASNNGVCMFDVIPNGLVGSTRFEFVR
jgi:Dolichyl-phosphate-mannose-protein mannosyltransferase